MLSALVALGFLVSPLDTATVSQLGSNAEIFVVKEKAMLLGPPMTVTAYCDGSPLWSPDGKFVLAASVDISTKALQKAFETMKPPDAEVQVVLWSSATRKSTVVYKVPANMERMPGIRELTWLSDSSTAYAVVSGIPSGGQSLLRISVGGSTVVTPLPDGASYQLTASPTRPLAVAFAPSIVPRAASGPPTPLPVSLIGLGPSGPIGSITLEAYSPWPFWSKSGRELLLARSRESRTKGDYLMWDFGPSARPSDEVPSFQLPEDLSSMDLQEVDAQLGQGTAKVGVKTLWLRAKAPPKDAEMRWSVLVGTDAPLNVASISPKEDAVLYVAQGVAMVRPLYGFPAEMLAKAKVNADKTRAISDAKQCALALIMYAADNDDNFPSSLKIDEIEPYIKNREMLGRFVYTYGGGNLNSIKEPANTEIGYVEGPGGRAIAYADGHVKWVQN